MEYLHGTNAITKLKKKTFDTTYSRYKKKITHFKAKWYLCVPPDSTLNNSALSPHRVRVSGNSHNKQRLLP